MFDTLFSPLAGHASAASRQPLEPRSRPLPALDPILIERSGGDIVAGAVHTTRTSAQRAAVPVLRARRRQRLGGFLAANCCRSIRGTNGVCLFDDCVLCMPAVPTARLRKLAAEAPLHDKQCNLRAVLRRKIRWSVGRPIRRDLAVGGLHGRTGCQEHCSEGALARKMGSAFSALQGASRPKAGQHVLMIPRFLSSDSSISTRFNVCRRRKMAASLGTIQAHASLMKLFLLPCRGAGVQCMGRN